MFSHIHIGIGDFEPAFGFYAPIMAALGLQLKFRDDAGQWAGWTDPRSPRPLLLIGKPFDGQPAQAGNGQMVALLAPSRAAVRQVHALALALGGTCEGAPGLRPHYHADYYGAYFRDLDCNKLCVCCHVAEPPPASL
jgi:catechol 2,3-dioxygenase-like lactoylglutathione lyase family enzyme